MSSTPIKRYNLTKEGANIYRTLERLIEHPFYRQGGSKNIPLKNGQFNLMREGLSEYDKKICKYEIPFFGHTLRNLQEEKSSLKEKIYTITDTVSSEEG